MKTVGLTGGIGSGKTTIARVFEILGVPVFYADEAGRAVLDFDEEVVQAVKSLFGAQAYEKEKANRKYIADKVFSDPALLAKLNTIVHPAVGRAFENWKTQFGNKHYVLKEAAILFESGTYKTCDMTILVSAPEELRVQRTMKRDSVSEEEVRGRMARQWGEERKVALADFVIVNDGKSLVIPQVLSIDREVRMG